MRTPSRPLRSALASVAGLSFLVFGIQAPAVAAEPPTPAVAASSSQSDPVDVGDASLADEPQLTLAGDLRVVIADGEASSHTEYAVATPAGDAVAITGDLPEGVSTGDAFTGTVAIPESVVEAVDDSHADEVEKSADAPLNASSAAGAEVVDLAATAGPLQIVTGTIDFTTAAAAATPRGHTIDVAIAAGTTFSDIEVDALLAGLNSYWTSQSAGVVTSVTRRGTIQRNVSPYCEQEDFWEAAASRFGKGPVDYWNNGRGEHLLVLTDSRCGAGLGTVGTQVHSGGLIWASVDDEVDLHTVGHEFGHNLGLGHSNVHECAEPTRVEGSADQGCGDLEYEDYFDIMSGGYQACFLSCVTTNKLGALNASHKRTLGFLPAGSTQTVTTTTTAVLQAASATAGLRTLNITDPVSHRDYQIEFRSGTGMDAGTFYATNWIWDFPLRMGIGVRVLTTNYDNGAPTSVAVAQEALPGRSKSLTLKPAQTFTSESGALRVTVLAQTLSTATVSVEFGGPTTIDRIQGDDRYATAVAIAKKGYTTADVVYVATGANYPDALSAAPAAVKDRGPLLLTPSDSLRDDVRNLIEDLKPTRIVVVGGNSAVSPTVFEALDAIPGVPRPDRIAGADRFATARAVVDDAFDSTATAYVATGNNFPDALSAAAAAGSIGAPVILVNGPQPTIDSDTSKLLDGLNVTKTVIVGGPNAVSAGIQSSLAKTSAVSRVAGDDRYSTSLAVNAVFRSPATVFLATGTQFPDALAGAALAGAKGAPLYVVQPTCIPGGTRSAILRSADTVTLLGGPGALSDGVMALRGC
ncbi:cell wall-binding repeat-containing protein [Mycetocola sp. 2940]|uniref:cell wall-binding repeat-containing protein n=1 Tax=Mycetocola sp. 2940 TaxID=3156452 RepID=UPI00339A7489